MLFNYLEKYDASSSACNQYCVACGLHLLLSGSYVEYLMHAVRPCSRET
jgi:hypothetical protein